MWEKGREHERAQEGQNNVSALVKKSDRINSRNGREIFPKLVYYCQDVGQSKYLIQRSKSSESVAVCVCVGMKGLGLHREAPNHKFFTPSQEHADCKAKKDVCFYVCIRIF